MTEKENACPTVGAVRQAVESGDICEMAHTSTTNDTTIGGSGQMGLIASSTDE